MNQLSLIKKMRLRVKALFITALFSHKKSRLKKNPSKQLPLVMQYIMHSEKRSFFCRYKYCYQLLKDHKRKLIDLNAKHFLHTIENSDHSQQYFIKREVLEGRKLFASQQEEYKAEQILHELKSLPYQPLISIIMPVYNTPVKWLEMAIQSIISQKYTNWELCVVDDCSTDRRPVALLEKYANIDSRIRPHYSEKNGGISSASNIALEMAKGEYIALVDHDDEITSDALFWFVKEMNSHPNADFLYCDECKINDKDDRLLFDFFIKPDWAPEMLYNFMYTGHLTLYKTDLVKNIGGFRTAYDFSQDYDLALRMSEVCRNIRHVERILYLWRAINGSAAKGGKSGARISNLAALDDAMKRRNINAQIIALPKRNYVKIIRAVTEKVSIIIPTDSYENAILAIDGVLHKTSYVDYEIVVVCNSKLAKILQQKYCHDLRVVMHNYDKLYNFSDKCNVGAQAAKGEILVFYNDDVSPIHESWVDALIEYLYMPGVGATSPKLLFKNGAIQYAGMISGTPGLAGTACNGWFGNGHPSTMPVDQWVRNVTILSGACLCIRKSVFFDVGCFDSIHTPSGHSDLDLSYKISDHGLRCVYTPNAQLYHIGNHSWRIDNIKDKSDIFMLMKYGQRISTDPFFTNSMKKLIYHDFNYAYKIFPSPFSSINYSCDALIYSHEMSMTGAPRLALNAAITMKELGFFCVIICPSDGPMRPEFTAAGLTVIIDEGISSSHWLVERFVKNFDFVLINTIIGYKLINQISKYNIPMLWWIHEGNYAIDGTASTDHLGLTQALKSVNYCYSVFPSYSYKFLSKFNHDLVIKRLLYGLEDTSSHGDQELFEYITFLIVGTIEPRKGHDIFVAAIASLPEKTRRKARFKIIGGEVTSRSLYNFYNNLHEHYEKFQEIEYIGKVSQEEVLSITQKSHVIVAPSRDDIGPLTIMQGMIYSKITIVSDHTGVSEVINDGLNGYVFKNENVKELSKKIEFVIENYSNLNDVCTASRQTYENYFTHNRFNCSINEIFDEFNLSAIK
jgi:glycosyltransferase involved in cell wall biosynthesis